MTSRYHGSKFLDDNKMELRQQQRDGNENEKGKNVYISKKTLHVHLQLVPRLVY